MKALTFHGVETLRHETVPDPTIEAPGDVVVRVEHASICGSDLHVYHGRETGLDAGTVMGHEFVGEVVEVGKDVVEIRAGDAAVDDDLGDAGLRILAVADHVARAERSRAVAPSSSVKVSGSTTTA